MAVLHVDVNEGVLRARLDAYDEGTVAALRDLPGRRYEPGTESWVSAAAREALTHMAGILRVRAAAGHRDDVAPAASEAILRCSPAIVTVGTDAIRVTGPYNRRRVAIMRDVPGATYDRSTRTWVAPRTRAAAAALAPALETWRFDAEPDDIARLARLAAATPEPPPASSGVTPGGRRAPIEHWKHYRRGPIFDANPARREWIYGIGWCVRVKAGHRAPRAADETG